jgi:uncharacterized iron-regulated membrane protein
VLIAKEGGNQTYHVEGPFLATALVLIAIVLLVVGLVLWSRRRRSRSTTP